MDIYNQILFESPDDNGYGSAEIHDEPSVLDFKLDELFKQWKEAKCIVVVAGAGLSKAAGVPDLRGPDGMWAMKRDLQIPPNVDFNTIRPTTGHKILRELERVDKVHKIVTLNLDGLFLKSGFPIDKLVEVRGNFFRRQCGTCGRTYIAEILSAPVRFLRTEKCEGKIDGSDCNGDLINTGLASTGISEYEQDITRSMFENSDLVVCLGTTILNTLIEFWILQTISCDGKVATINFQSTSMENVADIVIHGNVQTVLERISKCFELDETLVNSETGVHMDPQTESGRAAKRRRDSYLPTPKHVLALNAEKRQPTCNDDEPKIKIDRKASADAPKNRTAWPTESKIRVERVAPANNSKLKQQNESKIKIDKFHLKFVKNEVYDEQFEQDGKQTAELSGGYDSIMKSEHKDDDDEDNQGTSSGTYWFDDEQKPNIR